MRSEDEAPDDDLEEEEEGYDPCPVEIAEGGCLIFDPIEFAELTTSIAAIVRDGGLFVLDRDSLKWRNVEAKPGPRRVG